MKSLGLFSLRCYLQSLNVLLLLAPRFLSVALTCFSSLCRALNAKWWGDKTLSIKTCFMTTWDSWLVLQLENSGGFDAKVSLRDLTASNWLGCQKPTGFLHNTPDFCLDKSLSSTILHLGVTPILGLPQTRAELVNGRLICWGVQLSV